MSNIFIFTGIIMILTWFFYNLFAGRDTVVKDVEKVDFSKLIKKTSSVLAENQKNLKNPDSIDKAKIIRDIRRLELLNKKIEEEDKLKRNTINILRKRKFEKYLKEIDKLEKETKEYEQKIEKIKGERL